ncbi:hypothetical protein BpHYR1_053625 [Brachionus plicatilis]|uniref:Uncharacterized protein n=1 Tax=Brachionus plicatilis TaxID=10195 RepID=A0A3M7PHG7_BRAPC|nr:hypothetical protein BpHYR1_053625 [Brachionus plicatilis]
MDNYLIGELQRVPFGVGKFFSSFLNILNLDFRDLSQEIKQNNLVNSLLNGIRNYNKHVKTWVLTYLPLNN